VTEKPIHILYLASWYPNRNAPALGNFIQRHAQAASIQNRISVVYASAEKNMEDGKIEIIENHTGNLSEYLVHYGKVKSKIPLISKLKKRDAYRNAIRKGVDEAIKKNGKPDLLHVHVIWPVAIAALPLLNEMKIPLIISEHWSGYLPEDGNFKGVIQKNISKQLTEKAKHITVVSPKMETAMKKHGLGKTFSLLPNTVDTNFFKFSGKLKPEKGFKLLHVSMLVDREKNISGLLRVMKKISNHPEITLEIIGDGPERAQHEKLATELELLNKTVFFSGFKNATEIATAMQNACALVMFSNFEGMPVTIIEAQCCGLPVIATRTGSIPEMVNDSQGILVDVGNESELEKAILKLIVQKENYSSKSVSETAIGQYGLEPIGEKLNSLYRSILKSNGR
jgi:glycosyltransferase involved in cell wall biosynthesis